MEHMFKTICSVGWRDRDDLQYIEYLWAADLMPLEEGWEEYHDKVDLSMGRDFLKEDKKYDIVMLHFIESTRLQRHVYNTEATDKDWADRLIQTGAEEIFVFTKPEESGSTTELYFAEKELNGYELVSWELGCQYFRRK